MGKNSISISKKSTTPENKSPSAIGGEKESTMKNRNIITSVGLYSRSSEKFSQSAKKQGGGITTTGGK